MLKRLYWVFCAVWALIVIGLQRSSDPSIPPNAWTMVMAIAALPLIGGWALARVMRFVATGYWKRPRVVLYR